MKTLFLFLSIIIFTYNSNAQVLSGYGVKLGLGISNQSWDYNTNINLDFKNKIGIAPRIFADFFSYSFLQVEGELGFLRKGFTDKVPITSMDQPDGTGEFITINNGIDYLSFSVLAKLKYGLGMFSPYIIVGPQLNILLNKNINKGWEIVFDKFKKNNYGLSIGLGTEVKNVLPISFLLEYRYEKDFVDNYDSPNVEIKNYSHVILFGIKI